MKLPRYMPTSQVVRLHALPTNVEMKLRTVSLVFLAFFSARRLSFKAFALPFPFAFRVPSRLLSGIDISESESSIISPFRLGGIVICGKEGQSAILFCTCLVWRLRMWGIKHVGTRSQPQIQTPLRVTVLNPYCSLSKNFQPRFLLPPYTENGEDHENAASEEFKDDYRLFSAGSFVVARFDRRVESPTLERRIHDDDAHTVPIEHWSVKTGYFDQSHQWRGRIVANKGFRGNPV